MKGKIIYPGKAEGEAIVSPEPIGFYGGVDVNTGKIIERGHSLEGRTIKDKILVFPHGKGSTVGSYIIYGLKKLGNAPLAIVTENIDTVTAVGVIISEIPCIDGINIKKIGDGDVIKVDAEKGEVILQ
ncbi:MAG TPA: DUF126 domain-containing protein [Thermoplasmatales archaeon]|nr:DUF126 domain-containing protein [Thermoplasmatales archaeon]